MTTVKANIMVTHLLKTYPTHYARLKEFASYGSSALRNLQPQEVFKRTAKETQTKSMGSKCREWAQRTPFIPLCRQARSCPIPMIQVSKLKLKSGLTLRAPGQQEAGTRAAPAPPAAPSNINLAAWGRSTVQGGRSFCKMSKQGWKRKNGVMKGSEEAASTGRDKQAPRSQRNTNTEPARAATGSYLEWWKMRQWAGITTKQR